MPLELQPHMKELSGLPSWNVSLDGQTRGIATKLQIVVNFLYKSYKQCTVRTTLNADKDNYGHFRIKLVPLRFL